MLRRWKTRPRSQGGGTNHRLDEIDQAIAGIDMDARIRVSKPVFAINHAQFQIMAAGHVGIRSCAMARKRHVHILLLAQADLADDRLHKRPNHGALSDHGRR